MALAAFTEADAPVARHRNAQVGLGPRKSKLKSLSEKNLGFMPQGVAAEISQLQE